MASVSNLRETEEFINFPSKADHFNKTIEKMPRVIRDLQDYSPSILITEALRKQKKIKLKSDLMPAWLNHILWICDRVSVTKHFTLKQHIQAHRWPSAFSDSSFSFCTLYYRSMHKILQLNALFDQPTYPNRANLTNESNGMLKESSLVHRRKEVKIKRSSLPSIRHIVWGLAEHTVGWWMSVCIPSRQRIKREPREG